MKTEDETFTQRKVTSCLVDAGISEHLAAGLFDILSEAGQISPNPPPTSGAEKLGCISLQADRLFGVVEQFIYDPKLCNRRAYYLYCRQAARISFGT